MKSNGKLKRLLNERRKAISILNSVSRNGKSYTQQSYQYKKSIVKNASTMELKHGQ
jgi:hypothetical protein